MIVVEEKPYKQEELSLIDAVHSRDGNVLDEMSKMDYSYAHTVRGDSIGMLFSKPTIELGNNEKESYVFVSSGFYHGLRTYLYPEVDSRSNFADEIDRYVKKLKDEQLYKKE